MLKREEGFRRECRGKKSKTAQTQEGSLLAAQTGERLGKGTTLVVPHFR